MIFDFINSAILVAYNRDRNIEKSSTCFMREQALYLTVLSYFSRNKILRSTRTKLHHNLQLIRLYVLMFQNSDCIYSEQVLLLIDWISLLLIKKYVFHLLRRNSWEYIRPKNSFFIPLSWRVGLSRRFFQKLILHAVSQERYTSAWRVEKKNNFRSGVVNIPSVWRRSSRSSIKAEGKRFLTITLFIPQ